MNIKYLFTALLLVCSSVAHAIPQTEGSLYDSLTKETTHYLKGTLVVNAVGSDSATVTLNGALAQITSGGSTASTNSVNSVSLGDFNVLDSASSDSSILGGFNHYLLGQFNVIAGGYSN